MKPVGRKLNPLLWTEEEIREEQLGPASGEGPEGIEFPVSSPADRILAAELVGYLESEISLDTRRLILRVSAGRVYVQGTVNGRDTRERIESLLRGHSDVRDVEVSLTIAELADD